MKLAHCLIPFVVCAGAIPSSADSLTDYFPPDTKVAFGIRVHNLALSSVVQSFKTQAQTVSAEWLKLPLDNFDLLRDVDEVLIASNGRGTNPPAIIVVTGRFNTDRLTEGAEKYRDAFLLGSPKDGENLVALLDKSTVLIGTASLVRAAIDHAGKVGIDPELNDRITSLRQRYDIWGLGDQPEGFATPIAEAKGLENIDRFQFGVQLANGLELGAEIHTRTPEDLEKLTAALGMISGMFKGQEGSRSSARFDMETVGSTLKLNVSIPEQELKKTIETEAGVHSGTPPASEAAEPAMPDAVAEAHVTPPPAAPVVPAAPPAPADPPKERPKVPTAQVVDKNGNTVILTLPGKK